MHLQAHK